MGNIIVIVAGTIIIVLSGIDGNFTKEQQISWLKFAVRVGWLIVVGDSIINILGG